jgi:urease accessory protein
MICEKILGKLTDDEFAGKEVDYVDFQWDEAFKKLHRKTSRGGVDVGINLDDAVLTRGLLQDDVLAVEGDTVIAVNVEEAEAIKIMVEKGNLSTIAKVCYEIGNRHAPLFRGEDEFTFLTPFNGPMLTMIDKIPGLSTDVVEEKFDFETRISTSVSSHTH